MHLSYEPVDRHGDEQGEIEAWEELLTSLKPRQRDYVRYEVRREPAPENYQRATGENEKMIRRRIDKTLRKLRGENENLEEKDEN